MSMLQYKCDDDQGGPQPPKPPTPGWKKGDDTGAGTGHDSGHKHGGGGGGHKSTPQPEPGTGRDTNLDPRQKDKRDE